MDLKRKTKEILEEAGGRLLYLDEIAHKLEFNTLAAGITESKIFEILKELANDESLEIKINGTLSAARTKKRHKCNDKKKVSRRYSVLKKSKVSHSLFDKYRTEEFYEIAKQLTKILNINIEVDHANAICGSQNGSHEVSNLQLLSREHNRKKHNKDWKRFSTEEQMEYLLALFEIQTLVDPAVKSQNLKEVYKIVKGLINRLELVF